MSTPRSSTQAVGRIVEHAEDRRPLVRREGDGVEVVVDAPIDPQRCRHGRRVRVPVEGADQPTGVGSRPIGMPRRRSTSPRVAPILSPTRGVW